MDTDTAPAWFLSLLAEAKRRAGSRAALGRLIGVANPTIIAWEEGAMPRLDNYIALLAYMGGDPIRALPGGKVPTGEPSQVDALRHRVKELEGKLATIREVAADGTEQAALADLKSRVAVQKAKATAARKPSKN